MIPTCPPEKHDAIVDAFRHFKMIDDPVDISLEIKLRSTASMVSAFDESYQESQRALRTQQSNYDSRMKALVELYKGNLPYAYPKAEELTVYETKLAEFESCILENNQLIANKVASPLKVIELKDSDAIIAKLDELVSQINRQIQNNNSIVAAKSSKQGECNRMVWEKIAFILKDYVADYLASKRRSKIRKQCCRKRSRTSKSSTWMCYT